MYKKAIIITLIALITMTTLSSCKVQKEIEDTGCINIDMSRELIPYTTFINSIDSVPISAEKEFYLSSIEDICVGDSSIYLLDAMSNVLKINHSTGKVEKTLNIKGHSASECVSAKAITNSKENVYILDMYGLKILILDRDLNYIESIRLPVASMDFAAIPDGFLLFNLSCGDGDDLVISIDRKGNIRNKYIANSGIPDPILSKRIFTETTDGIIIVPPLQKKIFMYNDHTESVSCQYDLIFNSETTETKNTGGALSLPNAPIIAFESDKYVITNYMANQKVGTCIYDKKTGYLASGIIKTGILYPFTPMILNDNNLYSVYERNPAFGQEKGYVIMKYELKK